MFLFNPKLPFEKAFIATQGPKSSTTEDFWNMIIENKTKLIIMLCNSTENGRSKCHEYWTDSKYKYLDVETLEEKSLNDVLIIRTIQITDSKKEVHKVNQLHFVGWPDHGVPVLEDVYETFDYMLKETEDAVNLNTPVTVHCSAGVGRTGTYLTMFNNYFWINRQIENKTNIQVNMWNTVRKLKELRRLLVENVNQYTFAYKFIIKYLSKI